MKRAITIFLAVLMLAAALPLCGCALIDRITKPKDNKPDDFVVNTDYGSDSTDRLAENAVQLAYTCDVELIKKLLPQGEVDFYVNYYDEKNQDYYALLKAEFDKNAAAYAEACGDDWAITYKITKQNDKDADGVQQYRDFDNFYFEQYGLDPAKISAASYIYYDVTVSGSRGAFTKQKSMWMFEYEGRWYSFYMPRFGLSLAGSGNANG